MCSIINLPTSKHRILRTAFTTPEATPWCQQSDRSLRPTSPFAAHHQTDQRPTPSSTDPNPSNSGSLSASRSAQSQETPYRLFICRLQSGGGTSHQQQQNHRRQPSDCHQFDGSDDRWKVHSGLSKAIAASATRSCRRPCGRLRFAEGLPLTGPAFRFMIK